MYMSFGLEDNEITLKLGSASREWELANVTQHEIMHLRKAQTIMAIEHRIALLAFLFPFVKQRSHPKYYTLIAKSYSNLPTTMLRISSKFLVAFFGSFATLCHISPCLGSLSMHFAMTSARFS